MQNILYPLTLQIPTGTPNPGSGNSLDFTTPFDVIVFIVLPIAIIVLYYLYRKQKNKRPK